MRSGFRCPSIRDWISGYVINYWSSSWASADNAYPYNRLLLRYKVKCSLFLWYTVEEKHELCMILRGECQGEEDGERKRGYHRKKIYSLRARDLLPIVYDLDFILWSDIFPDYSAKWCPVVVQCPFTRGSSFQSILYLMIHSSVSLFPTCLQRSLEKRKTSHILPIDMKLRKRIQDPQDRKNEFVVIVKIDQYILCVPQISL